MAVSSVQLTAEVQFAERLSEDLISAVILDPLERHQILGEKSSILSAVRLDIPNDLPTLDPTPPGVNRNYAGNDCVTTGQTGLPRDPHDFQLYNYPFPDESLNDIDPSTWLPIGGSDCQTQSTSAVNNNSMTCLPPTITFLCDSVEGLSHDMLPHAPSPCGTSVGFIPGEPDEMEIEEEEGPNKDDITCDDQPPSHEASAGTPVPDSDLSYPTPNSNPRNTPILANKRLRKLAEAPPNSITRKEISTPSPSQSPCLDNHSFGQILDNYLNEPSIAAAPTDDPAHSGIRCTINASNKAATGNSNLPSSIPLGHSPTTPGFQPNFEDADSPKHHNDPESALANDSNFGDKDMQSALHDAQRFSEATPHTSETNLGGPPIMTVQSGVPLEDTDNVPDSILNSDTEGSNAASANSLGLDDVPARMSDLELSTTSQQEEADQVETCSGNGRKRRRAHISPEEYDGSSPRIARLSSEVMSDSEQQASASRASLRADEEDFDAQSFLSSPDPGPRSPTNEHTTETRDENDIHNPNSLESIFSKITQKEVAQVRSTGDQLLLRNLGSFLERHSQTWTASGFWSAPSLNITGSSSIVSRSNRAGLMNYLEGLKQEDETHCLKLCAARLELFLFFVREVECERKRGTAESALKKNATSNLCNTAGMTPAEAKKLRKSFYNNKQLGEYMWWCMYFFGPSFLLRCSQEARKKINNTHFQLDAMVAYVLHEHPHVIKPYPELDAAVVSLLTSGEFPRAFSRKDVQMWDQRADPESTATALSRPWQPFKADVVANKALASLHEWVNKPKNRLLTF